MPKSLKELLASITCREIIQQSSSILNRTGHSAPAQPICFDSALSLQEGCSALAAHKISSAPIYDAKEGGFIGMLDYRDLVTYVLEVFHKVPKDKHTFDVNMEVTDIVKRALSNKSDVPVSLIANLSKHNPMVSINSNESLSTAVSLLVKHKVHRIVVIEESEDSNRFIGVLSQSVVAAYVAANFGNLIVPKPRVSDFPNGYKDINELGLVKGAVISITQHETVLDGLYIMYGANVSSVAIVDRSGGFDKLIGNIGMSDLKDVFSTKGGWRKLYENAFKFFVELRSSQGIEANGNDRVPSFTVHPTTPLISAIEKIAATKCHRVWVVDDAIGKLVGVVSLTDILPFLL